MRSLKRIVTSCVVVAAALVGLAGARAQADFVVEDWNWNNSVSGYSGNIQNYGGTSISADTMWWLTGEPDADGTHDYVAGWRSNAPGEYITMYWNAGIPNVLGDDLVIRQYGGPSASANVLASVNGATFTQIGAIGGGTPQEFRLEYFDFSGVFDGGVSYVKVQRVANGANTGMFFDAFGGAVVPEPGAIALLATGAIALFVLRRRIRRSKD